MSTLKVNTIQNTSGGNASTSEQIAQGRAKAWVNFTGTGTLSSSDQSGVNDSFNISSVIDTGAGLYTINIDNDLGNSNYAVVVTVEVGGNDNNTSETVNMRDPALRTTGSFALRCGNTENNTLKDLNRLNAVVFGDQ